MALFKILKGQEKNLPANKTEGWAYVTTDEGNMYVDVSASKRVRIGAHADKADVATKAEGDTKPIREIYLAKLKQVTSDGTTFSFRGETGNGTNAPDLISIPLAGDKAGLISNAAQTIKGEKTFANGINFPTIATWPTPSTETYPIKSQGLIWSGSSDSAAIFYEVQASDKGMLVIESSDDSNAGLEIRNAASKKKVTIVDGRFIGDLTGTADYASKAQGDSQTIRSKYVSSVVKKSGSNYIFTVTKGDGTTNDVDLYFAASSSCGGDANVARSLRGAGRLDTQEKIDNFLTGSLLQYAVFKTAAQNNVNFASNDGMILSIPWDSSDYGAQIAFDDNTTPAVKVRGKNKTWGAWKTVAFTDGTIENANYADKAKGDTTSIRTTYIHKIKQVTSDGTTFTFRGEYGDGSNANDLITIPAASSSIAGLITTGAQTIAGNKTFANGLIVSATSGFNYSGIEAGTADSVRPIWFSDSNKSGTPVINSSKFTYNPYTNRMVVGNITLNGKDIASNYLTKVEKVDNIKVKATTGDGTSNTFTLDFLPLAGGTMTGAINFDHSQKRIISRTQLNSTTVNSGNNAHKLTLPVTNDNASTALMMHVANGNSDFGVFYLSEDTAFIANSGDTGYVFKVIDKDTNGGITDYNDNVSTMFAIKQGSGGIIMRGPLEPLVTESQNIGSTTMFWNNVYAKYFKGIADRATSDSGNQVIVDTYIKAIEYITHATQPKLKYTKGGGSTTELNMPIASASLAGLVTADAKDVIQSFSGDKTFNGCVRIKPTSDNARQGLRIGSVGGWSMITLGASSDAGYDVKSWHIANNNGAFYITHNGSSESSGSKGRLMSDENGNWQIHNRLGINGQNVGYQFYVNGTSLHTNTINIDPNTVALNFRYNDANLYSTISYQTSGNEALVFANKYPYASFLFITNEDSVTNHGSNRWQSLTNTGLQIKENCVQIGGLWGNDVHPDYKLKVNGTSYFTDNIRIPRTKALIQDQVSTSNYTSIIEWRKGGGAGQSGFTYNPQVGQYNVGGADGSGSICVLPYATSTDPWGGSVGLYICRGQAKLDGHRLLTSHYAAIDSGVKLASGYSWISIAGTSSFTCPDGTAITQPGGENPMVLYAGAASARDCGIFYLSNDNAYIANSSDNAYTFGVFDTDITQNFSTEGNASLCVRSNGAGTFIRSRLGVNGINDSYNFYVNGTSYFNGQVTATQFNGPLNGNATSATKLVYGPILNSDAAINSFHAANTFQAAVWNETSFPGVSNGIILDMGYVSATYGVQIAIDDDPTYFMALRQKGSSGWNAWKRIPMGDGTGASGTWSISITGNAANADTLDGYHASTVYRAATHGIQNYSATNDWLRIATITINGSTLSMGGFTAIFSNRECLDSSSFILTVAIRRNDTTSVNCQAYVTPIDTSAPREILVRSDDGVNFYVYFKSALNSWTTYYNVTKIMSENNVKFENVSLPASNLITGSVLNVTASRGGYVYRAQNADVATSSGYLTKKAAYTTIAEVDAFLEADKVQWVTVSAAATSLNNDGIVMSYGWNSSYGAQMYLDDGGGAANCYIRNRSGSGWNPWRRLWASGDSVTSAVWNDYAECRKSDSQEPGYVMFEKGDDSLSKTVERLQHFAGVVSDTWGFSQGETADAKTNIAVAGRVLAYPYRDRNEYKPGDCVCAAPGGKVDIMTREEIIQYPDRIVGTVSCVPDYEEWGGGELADRDPVKVNGRIWIKVK